MVPVLYLDIDDTLLSWADGQPRPVAGSEGFLRWALARFEVRWLTRWCPSGEMPPDLLGDLAKMVRIDPAELGHIRGSRWDFSSIKADGIAWLEHIALGREFAWVEDRGGVSDRDLELLATAGLAHCYYECSVTEDDTALVRVRHRLEERFGLRRADPIPREEVA